MNRLHRRLNSMERASLSKSAKPTAMTCNVIQLGDSVKKEFRAQS